ncbi:MAG: hypothetical protein BWY82_02238 [Verrucomicrobia bacterium ADurb.Bin474]|nr:MAG: hypothetical protein BWY82_02238 [Verrucomicrobia bacterium ADurb.Bin474]
MGNGSEVLDQVGLIHSDSKILDRERSGLVIGLDVDFERQVVIENGVPAQLNVPEFFQGIRCVGYQLADKDFFVGVERMNDDIEHLLDVGCKGMGFCHG